MCSSICRETRLSQMGFMSKRKLGNLDVFETWPEKMSCGYSPKSLIPYLGFSFIHCVYLSIHVCAENIGVHLFCQSVTREILSYVWIQILGRKMGLCRELCFNPAVRFSNAPVYLFTDISNTILLYFIGSRRLLGPYMISIMEIKIISIH